MGLLSKVVVSSSSASTAGLGTQGLNTMTFTADYEINEFNNMGTVGTVGVTVQRALGSAAADGAPIGIGVHGISYLDDVGSTEGSVLGDPPPTDRVQDLDIQSIIKAIQTISCELVLPNLISKLMKIILHNAGAQRATLLSRQPVQSTNSVDAFGNVTASVAETAAAAAAAAALDPSLQELEVEWRIDSMIQFDDASIYVRSFFQHLRIHHARWLQLRSMRALRSDAHRLI